MAYRYLFNNYKQCCINFSEDKQIDEILIYKENGKNNFVLYTIHKI